MLKRSLWISLFLLSACGPNYQIEAPEAFKRYEEGKFHWITADGVILRAREVKNYPVAGLSFWVDAMKGHLEKRGYALKAEPRCFETRKKLSGCTLDFLLPHGAEDWVMSETLFVVGERVILLEVAGSYERFSPLEGDLKKAMISFEPGS